jgi:hypothetical protein
MRGLPTSEEREFPAKTPKTKKQEASRHELVPIDISFGILQVAINAKYFLSRTRK